jgi:hypothetical protein
VAWVPHWTVMKDGRLGDRAAVEKALGTIRRCLCEDAQYGRAVGGYAVEEGEGGRCGGGGEMGVPEGDESWGEG